MLRLASSAAMLAALFLAACGTPSVSTSDDPLATATARPTESATPQPTPPPAPTPPFDGPAEDAVVVGVVDGDTIDVEIDGEPYRLRYIGMDTPETRSGVECLGSEAADANRELVGGQQVVLERDVSEVDQFGRLLRYVWLHEGDRWLMANAELVRLGFAQVATSPPDVKYADTDLLEAQREAMAAGRALWGAVCATPTPRPTPVPTPLTLVPPPPPSNCDPSYPDDCIPPAPPDLDCGDIPYRRFTVLPPDPHGFDGDYDGIGCESG